MLKKNSKIFIAGHNGLVGNAVKRKLLLKNYRNIITADKSKLNLLDKNKIDLFFKKKKPTILIICAAKVGGILENKNYQLEFLLENLQIQTNLLSLAKKYKVKRTVFLGSSCIYPGKCKIPIKEEYLMTGKLEPTNEAYALSKIIGLKLSSILVNDYKQDIVCLMPTNLYGVNDNFNISSSHVIPGLISKFLRAKKSNNNIKVWGSGKPTREFLFVDDLADAILHVLSLSKKKLIKASKNNVPIFNVGSGDSITIKKLAYKIKKLINFKGKIIFDKSYPDGTINKNLDSSKIYSLNWKPKVKLNQGLKQVIDSKMKKYDTKYK
jgi:GDP-L-fucose synthase